eukprot:Plantae.Rhodophyta-Hildenbrandia_rubra.ctg10878.p1 GENE.Plantae.Rhodophyta-Hildenbrandia_rubra.ctg10878~~Plantae.Rhodophyta-Hildenbrandia_rubra.ctg10878.p1  ORF type:complete len:174 (-),score=26.71 Plantae.Rhodophyta-Hildenbrandia_rubra.ctg10878:341-862(-)
MIPVPPIVVALGAPLTVGVIGSVIAAKGVAEFWPKLKKPKWCPPAPVFGQVWSVLYAMMGYASLRVWKVVAFKPTTLWVTYGVQLVLNAAWNPIMFAGRKIDAAMVDIVALSVAATISTVQFGQVDRNAGLLMVPYLGWIAFAAALNWSFLKKNPRYTIGNKGPGAKGSPASG